jgi:hypothetical protein
LQTICEIYHYKYRRTSLTINQLKIYDIRVSLSDILETPLFSDGFRKDRYFMNLREIGKLVEGTPLNPDVGMDIKIRGACGADLMSDVLASSKPKAVLLTGLTNPQVVRTAQIAEFRAIIFVRGKQPQAETIDIATQEKMPLITSPFGMFELCGRLHKAGLPSFESNEAPN